VLSSSRVHFGLLVVEIAFSNCNFRKTRGGLFLLLNVSRMCWSDRCTGRTKLVCAVMYTFVKGFFFAVVFIAGAIPSLLLLFPTLFFLSIPSSRVIAFRRNFISSISGIYFSFVAAIVTYYCGIKIKIYSDSPEVFQDKNVLIISNHRTRVDWIFVGWCYCALLGFISELKLILKDALRYVPIFGWCMQFMMYIFLTRKKELDISHISKMLNYLNYTGLFSR